MASATAILNNEVEFTLKNGGELDLDFSFDQFSPNPSFVSPFVMQFVCTPSENPIDWFNRWIRDNSIINSPSTIIVSDNFNIVGQAKLSSSQSYFVRDQGVNTEYGVLFEPYNNNFFEKSKELPLSAFVNLNNDTTTTVRYVTERNNPTEDLIFLVVATQFAIEAAQVIYNTADAIKEAVSTGFDTLSSIIKVGLKIAMNLIYAAAVLFALNELLKQASEIIFDKPKQLNALDVWEVIREGCKYLGYNFESSLENELRGLTLLLSTTTEGKTTGTPINNTIPNYSLFDFIERISLLFRGKLKVTQELVQLENEDFYEQNPSDVILNNVYQGGQESYNFEELPEFIFVGYQKNDSDNNYKDNFYGVQFLSPNTDPRNYSIENKIQIDLPYSLGQRKESETSVEKIFNSIFDIVKGLSSNYKVSVGTRLGFLKLQQDFVTADTLFIRDGERIANNSNELLQAQNLYNNYYDGASPLNFQFVTVTGRGKDRICGEDTNKLIQNNVARDQNGRTIIVTKNIKNNSDESYDIEYKRRLRVGDFGFIDNFFIEKKEVINVGNI